MGEYSPPSRIKLDQKNTGIKFDCLAFADDVVFFEETLEVAIEQVEMLKEIAEKAGLQVYFEKREYMNVDVKDPTWVVRIMYDAIKRANKFKYIVEILIPNINEKGANWREKWN